VPGQYLVTGSQNLVLMERITESLAEVKLSATPRPAMASGIESLRGDLGSRVAKGYVIHPGDIELPLGPGTMALPFGRLW
jgi:hypothetical protein